MMQGARPSVVTVSKLTGGWCTNTSALVWGFWQNLVTSFIEAITNVFPAVNRRMFCSLPNFYLVIAEQSYQVTYRPVLW